MILRKFSIDYKSYEVGARFLDILINYFANNQFLNLNSLRDWINITALLKENYNTGKIYMSITDSKDSNEVSIEIEITLYNPINLKKETIKNEYYYYDEDEDNYKVSGYWYNYKEIECSSRLKIICNKLSIAPLRKSLLEFFRDEKNI